MLRIMGERTRCEITSLSSDMIKSILTAFFFKDYSYIFFCNSVILVLLFQPPYNIVEPNSLGIR